MLETQRRRLGGEKSHKLYLFFLPSLLNRNRAGISKLFLTTGNIPA
jgi:hypothetical protein